MYFLRAAVCAAAAFTTLTFAAPAQSTGQYAGTKILRVPTGSQEQTDKLANLINTLGVPTWTSARVPHSHVDVQVSKDRVDSFHKALKEVNPDLDSQVITMHDDLAVSIAKEAEGMNSPYRDAFAGLANEAWFNSYHTYADHLQFLKDLATTFPNNAKVVTSGTSYEGRTITGINIYGSSGSGTKPAVIFHGTVHAREWIGTLVTEQIAYSLLSNYTTSSTIKSYVDKYDFYIFPIALLTPNRTIVSGARTVSLLHPARPATDVTSTETGHGNGVPAVHPPARVSAGDSPEFKALSAFLNARANSAAGAKLYIDFHAYGLYFMGPYGYSCTANAADKTEHTKMEQGFAAAFKAPYGKTLKTGPICQTIYQASGSSVDYAYGYSKIKYSFTPELRGASSGNGFVLPPAEIKPSGIEAYEGVKYLLANMV
ncbi:hypothetical protein BN14_07187 [Rhizoctonia solani AG-1 IB]|uniref:Peptidase M14 domain-containing protein n=1 Tax=Thanatephorus cucumeris (strain AG1-IB / isolate 7/3/14) TaxID=1108050 RepID=M5CBE1_THACB|nr:hypothetical protein BN14_07187 [Rhizoctonia solani AG-1 IB]